MTTESTPAPEPSPAAPPTPSLPPALPPPLPPRALQRHPLVGAVVGLWQGVDFLRRLTFNALFVLFLMFLLALALADSRVPIPSGVALRVAPEGDLVEQLDADEASQAVASLVGDGVGQTVVREVVEAIELAATDNRIKVLVLDLDAMGSSGLSKLQEVKAAIDGFKARGKKVVAVADDLSQPRYYLAAQADEVLLHPLGMVFLEGYGRFENYYKEALDNLGVEWHVFRVGTYKSAVEPYLLNGMSEDVRASDRRWLDALWTAFKEDVAAARGLAPAQVESYVQEFAAGMRRLGGDSGKLALETGLVDRLADREAMRRRLIELAGEDEATGSYRHVNYQDYREAMGAGDPLFSRGPQVAVLVARGDITYGDEAPGQIGSESTAELIRKARRDPQVKALVLRIDSGGGSTFGSEVIRRELELTRQTGKPVVISMGGVAASGAYWIATAGDEIWASPTTITGSIGIFSTFPTFEAGLGKLGIRTDGVGTTPLSGAFRQDLGLPQPVAEALQLSAEDGYRQFLRLVAEARKMTPEAVDEIAQGRVWSAADAQQRGLVDHLGRLADAVAAAAARAELEPGKYHTRVLEEELTLRQQLLLDLLGRSEAWIGPVVRASRPQLPELGALHLLARDLQRMSQLRDPAGVYAMCFCEPD